MAFFRTCSDQPSPTSPLHAVIASRAKLGVAISPPRSLIVAVVAACIVFASTAAAKTIYVDDDAAGLNNGTSWPNAYTFLQDALADADSADKPVEIRVAQGTYRPDQGANQTPGDREASFHLISDVAIKGGHAGLSALDPNARDIAQYETILSGDLAGNDIAVADPCDLLDEPTRAENSYHVVTGLGHEDSVFVLDGITVAFGNAADTSEIFGGRVWAGGVSVSKGTVTLISCTVVHSSARAGGGISVDKAHLKLTSCLVKRNCAKYAGGGIYSREGSDVIATDSTFADNVAQGDGGALWTEANLSVTNSGFRDNSGQWGGAIAIYTPVAVQTLFDRVVVKGNTALRGGGIHTSGFGPVKILNCLIIANSVEKTGGGIYTLETPLTLISSTVVGNRADDGGGLIWETPSSPLSEPSTASGDFGPGVANCIFRGNMASAPSTETAQMALGDVVSLRHNCIEGWSDSWNGIGNIGDDPQFVDQGSWDPNGTPDDPNDDFWIDGDYHLKSQAGRWDPLEQTWVPDDLTSPCVDAADPMSPIGHEPFPNGGIVNMGAYGGTAEASKSYFGEPVCETITAGDINGDCGVDYIDLVILCLHWLEDRTP